MIATPSIEFRRAHEQHAQLCDEAEATEMDRDWKPVISLGVTDAEIDSLIERIAETGHYEDELGAQVKASELIRALAHDWCDDPMRLPGYTYTAFVKWATCTAALAKFGK